VARVPLRKLLRDTVLPDLALIAGKLVTALTALTIRFNQLLSINWRARGRGGRRLRKERRMRARLLRALFLVLFAVMLAVYAVSIATSAPPADLHHYLQIVIVGEQWC
jgi:hypothetical protein